MDTPAPLKAIGFTEPLIDIAGKYWGERIKIARRQRAAVLNMIAFTILSLNVSILSAAIPEGNGILTFLKWLLWIAVGASVAMLALLEVATYQHNQALGKPPLPMNQEQRSTVIKLGNGLAIGVLMFKKPPVANQFSL